MPIEDPVAAAWYDPFTDTPGAVDLSAETPAASTVHHPFGSPSGPGLFRMKGAQLPAYIQNVAHALLRTGRAADESSAIQIAVGVIRRWASGGGKVSPEVRAAAAKAIAEWESLKAAAHGHANDHGRAIELVGPKGFVHGWIFVGAPGADHHISEARKADAEGRHADAINHLTAAIGKTADKKAAAHLTGQRSEMAARAMGRPYRPKVPAKPKAAGNLLGEYKGWRDGLTPAEDKAMRFYQSPGFALMNGQLRGLDAEALKSGEHASDSDLARARLASKNLTKAIAKAPPLPRDVTVYRGFDAGQFGTLKPGQVITDKGFTSTSITDDAGAVGRAGSKGQSRILLPAGTRAAAGSARELVLPPGSSFRVVRVQVKAGGTTHVELELIPKGSSHANDGPSVDLAGMFTEALHPRAAGGKFGSKGGSPVAAARARNTPASPAVQPAAGPAGPMTHSQQLRYQAAQDRHLAQQVMVRIAALVRARDAAIAGISPGKVTAPVNAAKSAAAKKAALARKTGTAKAKAKTAARKTTGPKRTRVQRLNGQIKLLRNDARLLIRAANKLDAQAAGQ